MDNKELDDIIAILDGMGDADISRLKINASDEVSAGNIEKEYHHGRCDIGSPWACGTAFDVLE